jgi:hypothetical protein
MAVPDRVTGAWPAITLRGNLQDMDRRASNGLIRFRRITASRKLI